MLPASFLFTVVLAYTLLTEAGEGSSSLVTSYDLNRHSANFLNTRQAFCPPNPKELDRATFTC